jgi:branched-chain amino acid transport system substrate-binding protein
LRVFAPILRRFLRARLAAAASLILCALALSACNGMTIPGVSAGPQAPAPARPGAPAPATQPPATIVQPAAPVPAEAAAKTRVGLLLPLSGPNATLGNAMLDAAQMALFDAADEKLELVPQDTQGTPQGAADAARTALAEGAKLMIGPLLAAEVEAAKPVAKLGNVPLIAFSTSTQLAGEGTYLMGFLPRQEIERVVAFAHGKGANRFAVFAPRSAYGEVAVEAMREASQKAGASLDRVEFFDPALPDLTPVVKRFAAGGRNFDALLLPVEVPRLKVLAPLLAYYEVDPDKVHYLGTGLWDEPGLGSEPALNGGWYAAPPPAARADFEKRFRDLYRRAPPRLATLAYDATALAAVLAHGEKGPDFSAAALTNPSGFAGVDGIFRFLPDGLVQRGLAVLEVHKDGPSTVIDPAPETFQSVNY